MASWALLRGYRGVAWALPLAGLSIASLWTWAGAPRRVDRLILPIVTLAILIAGFSGIFDLETERIRTLFLRWLALGAAVEVVRHNDATEARMLLVLLIVFAHGGF